jgi:polyhydroxyalkanoate synthesis regulator phasin
MKKVKTHKINDMEQLRLLGDPFKLRLIQAFAEGEKTTKQVAQELGERITKLYRHVDALHDSGLLEIVSETPKRGTIERTFRAIAERFEVDHALLSDASAADGSETIRELLRAGETEILRAIEQTSDDEDANLVVTRFRMKGSREQITRLRKSLEEWLEMIQQDQEDIPDDYEEAGAMIAFYPIVDE